MRLRFPAYSIVSCDKHATVPGMKCQADEIYFGVLYKVRNSQEDGECERPSLDRVGPGLVLPGS